MTSGRKRRLRTQSSSVPSAVQRSNRFHQDDDEDDDDSSSHDSNDANYRFSIEEEDESIVGSGKGSGGRVISKTASRAEGHDGSEFFATQYIFPSVLEQPSQLLSRLNVSSLGADSVGSSNAFQQQQLHTQVPGLLLGESENLGQELSKELLEMRSRLSQASVATSAPAAAPISFANNTAARERRSAELRGGGGALGEVSTEVGKLPTGQTSTTLGGLELHTQRPSALDESEEQDGSDQGKGESQCSQYEQKRRESQQQEWLTRGVMTVDDVTRIQHLIASSAATALPTPAATITTATAATFSSVSGHPEATGRRDGSAPNVGSLNTAPAAPVGSTGNSSGGSSQVATDLVALITQPPAGSMTSAGGQHPAQNRPATSTPLNPDSPACFSYQETETQHPRIVIVSRADGKENQILEYPARGGGEPRVVSAALNAPTPTSQGRTAVRLQQQATSRNGKTSFFTPPPPPG